MSAIDQKVFRCTHIIPTDFFSHPKEIERMVVFMLWLLTFVTTLATKNGAFVHHGNILVTAKMVICVSVAKIKLHTAVFKYEIYFLSSRGNHDRDVIIAVTE